MQNFSHLKQLETIVGNIFYSIVTKFYTKYFMFVICADDQVIWLVELFLFKIGKHLIIILLVTSFRISIQILKLLWYLLICIATTFYDDTYLILWLVVSLDLYIQISCPFSSLRLIGILNLFLIKITKLVIQHINTMIFQYTFPYV